MRRKQEEKEQGRRENGGMRMNGSTGREWEADKKGGREVEEGESSGRMDREAGRRMDR